MFEEAFYGFVVTKDGRELIAKLVAGQHLNLSRIMVGTGKVPSGTNPRELTDLVQPVALATSTEPVYDKDTVSMVVEYRSDLNGGLDHGIWLNEFGIFAIDPEKGEVLIYYGSLGDYPQWVCAASKTAVDTRRFPVSIIIGEDMGVDVNYRCEAWMTAEDVAQYCMITILPVFLEEAQKLIDAHNVDPEAHYSIKSQVSDVDARLSLLELMYNTSVDGNPFVVTFANLDGLLVEGVWNEPAKRIEF